MYVHDIHYTYIYMHMIPCWHDAQGHAGFTSSAFIMATVRAPQLTRAPKPCK